MSLFKKKYRYDMKVAGIIHYQDNIPRSWYHKEDADTYETVNTKLIPEPDNIHDKNAIKIVAGGIHIGYVPKKLIKEVREILQQDVRLIDTDFIRMDDKDWATTTITYYRR